MLSTIASVVLSRHRGSSHFSRSELIRTMPKTPRTSDQQLSGALGSHAGGGTTPADPDATVLFPPSHCHSTQVASWLASPMSTLAVTAAPAAIFTRRRLTRGLACRAVRSSSCLIQQPPRGADDAPASSYCSLERGAPPSAHYLPSVASHLPAAAALHPSRLVPAAAHPPHPAPPHPCAATPLSTTGIVTTGSYNGTFACFTQSIPSNLRVRRLPPPRRPAARSWRAGRAAAVAALALGPCKHMCLCVALRNQRLGCSNQRLGSSNQRLGTSDWEAATSTYSANSLSHNKLKIYSPTPPPTHAHT